MGNLIQPGESTLTAPNEPPFPSMSDLHILVRPTLSGRLVLVLLKLRWCLLIGVPVYAYTVMVIMSEMRIRDDGLRHRMTIAANLLTKCPNSIDQINSVVAPGTLTSTNAHQLMAILQTNWCLPSSPNEAARFALFGISEAMKLISLPETNRTGHYAKVGVNLRVRSDVTTREQFRKELDVFNNAISTWKDKIHKGHRFFISDLHTPWWPADEFGFYDYKRGSLNELILTACVVAFGILAVLLGVSLGGLKPPSWKAILKDPVISIRTLEHPKSPFNKGIQVFRCSNWWVALLVGLSGLYQYLQYGEHKEMFVEAWLNHPISPLIMLAVVFSIVIGVSGEPTPHDPASFCCEDYVSHFRSIFGCILCVFAGVGMLAVYSIHTLSETDPKRTVIQLVLAFGVSVLASIGMRTNWKRFASIKCRASKENKDIVELRNYWLSLLLPIKELPLLLLNLSATVLFVQAFGKFK